MSDKSAFDEVIAALEVEAKYTERRANELKGTQFDSQSHELRAHSKALNWAYKEAKAIKAKHEGVES